MLLSISMAVIGFRMFNNLEFNRLILNLLKYLCYAVDSYKNACVNVIQNTLSFDPKWITKWYWLYFITDEITWIGPITIPPPQFRLIYIEFFIFEMDNLDPSTSVFVLVSFFVFIYVKMMYHVSFSTIGVIVKILGYPLKINTWRWFNGVNLVGLCKPATSFCIVRIVCGCTKMVSLRWQYQFPSSLWLVSLSWLTVFHARLSSTAHFYD